MAWAELVVLTAVEACVAATTFLVGFASLRLHGHRERALQRSDHVVEELTRASRSSRTIDDREILETETALAEASRLDPVTRWTLIVAGGIASLTFALAWYSAIHEQWRFTTSPSTWSPAFVSLSALIVVELLVVGLGIIDYRWVESDFAKRIGRTVMGRVRGALAAYAEARFTDAVRISTELLREIPVWPWLWAFRSQCLHRAGDDEQALRDARRAAELSPDNPMWRLHCARISYDLDEYDAALSDTDAVLKALPGDVHALSLRGLIHQALGNRDLALADFDAALAKDPGDTTTRNARVTSLLDINEQPDLSLVFGVLVNEDDERVMVSTLTARARSRFAADDLAAAERDLSKVLDRDARNVRALALRGFAHARRGDRQAADQDFRAALELESQSPDVRTYRGRALVALGDNDEALDEFSRALHEDPDYLPALLARANTHAISGHARDAVRDFDEVLEKRPDDATSRVHRALAFGALGERDKAFQDFDRVLTASPGDVHALWTRATVYMQFGDYEAAIADVARAIEIDGESPLYLSIKADAEGALGRYEDALHDSDRALELDSDYEMAFRIRAQAKRALGRVEESIPDYDAAISAQPESASLIASRGTAKKRLGRREEALADLEAADRLEPDNVDILIPLGCTKMELGRPAEAMPYFERSLELQPNNISGLLHRGDALLRLGRPVEALDNYELALRIEPDEDKLKVRKVSVLLELDEPERAVQLLDEILAADVQPRWLRVIGGHLDNAGDFARAKRVFDRYRELTNSSTESLLCSAIVASQQRDSATAASFFDEALKDPSAEAEFDRLTDPSILQELEAVMADWSAALRRRDDRR